MLCADSAGRRLPAFSSLVSRRDEGSADMMFGHVSRAIRTLDALRAAAGPERAPPGVWVVNADDQLVIATPVSDETERRIVA